MLWGWGQLGGVGESNDAGGPGADLHHHVDSRTEGVSNGHSSQGGCKMWPEQSCIGAEVNISPRRRKQSPGAPDASSRRTVGSRNAVASASDAPATLHGM